MASVSVVMASPARRNASRCRLAWDRQWIKSENLSGRATPRPAARRSDTSNGCEPFSMRGRPIKHEAYCQLIPVQFRSQCQRQCESGQTPAGKNDREPSTTARAEFSRRVLFRRYRGRTGALQRRHRFRRQCASGYPAAYGASPRQGRGRSDVEDRPQPIFQYALRSADHRRRGRQGRGQYARLRQQTPQQPPPAPAATPARRVCPGDSRSAS